jgi:hypothetical protein
MHPLSAVDVLRTRATRAGYRMATGFNWKTKIATTVEVIVQRAGDRARWERLRDDLLEAMRSPDLFYC